MYSATHCTSKQKLTSLGLYLALGKFWVQAFHKSVTIIANNIFIMFVGCISQPKKFESLFLSRFFSVTWQTVQLNTKIKIFMPKFDCSESRSFNMFYKVGQYFW